MTVRVGRVGAVLALLAVSGCGDRGEEPVSNATPVPNTTLTPNTTSGPQAPFDSSGIISPGEDWLVGDAFWSADGQHVAFFAYDDDLVGRVYLAVEGEAVAVTPPELDITTFGWMPDSGAFLVAHKDEPADPLDYLSPAPTELAVVGLDGKVRRVVPTPELDIRYGIDVASDGVRAVVSGGPSVSGLDFPGRVMLIDMDSGAVTELPEEPGYAQSNPRFLNDRTVVYWSRMIDAEDRHLVSIELETAQLSRIDTGELVPFDFWSVMPDGEHVLFQSWTEAVPDDFNSGFWSVDVQGHLSQVAFNGLRDAQQFDIHPDGHHAVFRRYDLRRGFGLRFHITTLPK